LRLAAALPAEVFGPEERWAFRRLAFCCFSEISMSISLSGVARFDAHIPI